MYTFAIIALLALATLKLVDYLDDSVGDYVVIVTADHGHYLVLERPEDLIP